MRVVLDTNVIVSAALKASSWPAFVLRWADISGVLLKTEATERELRLVLARPRILRLIPQGFVGEVQRIMDAAESVAVAEVIHACRDAKDDKFLEAAVNGKADVLVSGDDDLLALHPFRGIPILDAATFGRSLTLIGR